MTAQVKALEEALDRPLFDRLPRGVAPTAAADELARRVAGSLDALDAVVEAEPAPINTGYLAVRSGGLARAAVARVHTHLLAALRAAPPY